MSKCVEKLPHSCGSKDGLQVFLNEDGKYTGYCFRCNTYIDNPYSDKPDGYKPTIKIKSKEQIQAELDEISTYQCLDLSSRGLDKEYLEHYEIKVAVSEEDGVTPTAVYFPYRDKDGNITGYKCRLLSQKTMWVIGSIKGSMPFGWKEAVEVGGRKLFITEGEFDSVALLQIFKTHQKGTPYAHLTPAIISLPSGASSAKRTLVDISSELRRVFKEIVLVYDNDEAGKQAVQESLLVFPDAQVAVLPAKDANDCLLQGRIKAAFNAAVFQAQKPKNTRLINASSLHEASKQQAEYGVPYPWESLTRVTRGIRTGETIYLGAAQKMGKSEVVNTLAAHLIKEVGWKVCLIKPEESNNKTYKLVAGKMVGKVFHDPNVVFDEEEFDKAGQIIGDNLFLLNLYQHVGWETLKADIREAATLGCKAIFIDPITNLVNGLDSGTQNTKLQEIAQELAAMAKDLDVVIFIFCHLRNPDSGLPHERGGEVLSSQFAGSRAMARSCNYMFGIEGNKDPSLDEETRNLRTIVLLEDREFGETGRFTLYWDKKTQLFNEVHNE